MTSSKPLVWLITGCSSGFGEALTFIVLRAGHKVIATSRTPSRTLELVKQVGELGGIWLPFDVSSPLSAHRSLVKEGIDKYGRIDVLVNCAGMSVIGSIEDFSHDEAHLVMETNFFGPLRLIQAIIPHMRAQMSGTIVNISSGAGIDPLPSMGLYAASKFALEGLSECLVKELTPFGIRILIVQPGAFATNMINAVIPTQQMTPAYNDTPLGQFVKHFNIPPEKRTFKAAGDVNKGCQGIFEVVTGTGRGEGKEDRLRLVLISSQNLF
ncbi:putative short chain oxidoreductase/dehydrogenase [Rhexocercosporidium sp. MPI-PUGE-AT-0058]|nr:putative short chain oxidoreductase/dehydrogenase [Rhexocercosporidium sp. MPI-PUGE-AT-0058]